MGKNTKRTKIYIYDVDNEEILNLSREGTSFSIDDTTDTDEITVFESESKEYECILEDFSLSVDAILKRKTKEELEKKWNNVNIQVFPNGDDFGDFGVLIEDMFRTSRAISSSISEAVRYSATFNVKSGEQQDIEGIVRKLKRSANLSITNSFEITNNSKLILNIFEINAILSPELVIKFWYNDGVDDINYDTTIAITEEGQYKIDIPQPPVVGVIKISVEATSIDNSTYNISLIK